MRKNSGDRQPRIFAVPPNVVHPLPPKFPLDSHPFPRHHPPTSHSFPLGAAMFYTLTPAERAFVRGRRDALSGSARFQNPYTTDPALAMAWLRGFDSGRGQDFDVGDGPGLGAEGRLDASRLAA